MCYAVLFVSRDQRHPNSEENKTWRSEAFSFSHSPLMLFNSPVPSDVFSLSPGFFPWSVSTCPDFPCCPSTILCSAPLTLKRVCIIGQEIIQWSSLWRGEQLHTSCPCATLAYLLGRCFCLRFEVDLRGVAHLSMRWNIGETHCKGAFEGFCVHSSVLVLEQSRIRARSMPGMQNVLYLGASATEFRYPLSTAAHEICGAWRTEDSNKNTC